MDLDALVRQAHDRRASDLHLEAGQPVAFRDPGGLKLSGGPLSPAELLDAARRLLGEEGWSSFLAQRSADFSRVVAGVRCRINVLQTSRGVGLAVRLLYGFRQGVEELNLHPDLRRLLQPASGLVLVCGPTGSGKSTTLAAFIQEVAAQSAKHIITIEQPIEFNHRSSVSLIRQREVGRDTPSFAHALHDALREDPDVIVVGEMRTPEVMQLTLNAAETGHLVFATLHSSSTGEALNRVIASFAPEAQAPVAAALADCLVGVVCQRLVRLDDKDVRAPECEVLMATSAVKGMVRNREIFRTQAVLETGKQEGMWTFARYRRWLDGLPSLHRPVRSAVVEEGGEPRGAALPPLARTRPPPAARGGRTVVEAGAPEEGTGALELKGDEGDEIDSLIQQLSRGR